MFPHPYDYLQMTTCCIDILTLLTDSHALQTDLNKLQKWESMWQMEINRDKCEVLRMTLNTKIIITGTYLIHRKVLKFFPSAKYLGITIGSTLTFNEDVDNI